MEDTRTRALARGHANRAGGERQRMTVNGLSLSSIMQIP
jgi:hypothetical protein